MSVLDRFRLGGRVALVTGVKRGIGRALTVALAEAGADIIGVSASLESTGSSVEAEVTARGRRFWAYAADLGDRAALYQFVGRVRAECPPVDILVNNAGTIVRTPAVDHNDESWDRVIAVNQTAQFILAREFGREMVERGRGKILFIASVLAYQGGILVPGYAASKGAVAQLTKALANEWAPHGVNVNAIAPGYIATENTGPLRGDPERNAQLLARMPAGRWGEVEDLQGAAVYLCSAAADYVHGTILNVDGGWLAR